MDITFDCDSCGQHIVVDGAGVGLDVECPKCGQPLTVPSQPQQQVEPSATTSLATRTAIPPETKAPLADFRHLLGRPVKYVERAVRQRRNQIEVAKMYDELAKLEKTAQEIVQLGDSRVGNLESRLRSGELPAPMEIVTITSADFGCLCRSTDNLVYSNLVGNFLGSTQEWLAGLTEENPKDERIMVLKPLLDKWTKIVAAGGLREEIYSNFLADLTRISGEHPSFYKPEECREFPCNTLLDVQRRIEALLNKPELERRLRKLEAPMLILCDRIDRLRHLTATTFQEFIGQAHVKERLEIAIEASGRRGEALPHVLLVGPHGMGKATLGHLIARMTGADFFAMAGEKIRNAGSIPSDVAKAEGGFVLLVEDAERMRSGVREDMLRFINLPRFTLIGTTTRIERLPDAMLSRFPITLEFTNYTHEELAAIGQRLAVGLGLELDQPAAAELAKRSNHTPRGVLNSMRHVKDYALVKSESQTIIAETVVAALGATGAAAQEDDESAPDRRAIPSSVRMEVWRRDGGKCVRCGSRENLEYDHIIPVSKGGSNTARNIELLCETCNRSKRDSIQ